MKTLTAIAISLAMLFTPASAGANHAHHARPVPSVIMQVFGKRAGPTAVRIAWCESRWQPWQRNRSGHWGLFQMDYDARKKYGYGHGAWAQAVAAKQMFKARHWQPWDSSASCWRGRHTLR